jgi:ABC-type sugar transport system substrate-binding protein
MTRKRVAMLLDDPDNLYHALLARDARATAGRLGLDLADPEFARGSSWTQVDSINRHLREGRPDGLLMILAGGQWTRGPFERLVKAGVAVVLLNRVPDWVEGLRRDYPSSLVAAVTPRQEGIGETQARQALRMAAPGSFVVLVTGDAGSAAAIGRKRGFVETVGRRLSVHDLDGRWSAAGAEKALAEWFRLGAERDRPLGLVVCQNDAMARGARAALLKQAAAAGREDLLRVPLVGCDGLEDEGMAMVARGDLAATVVMPSTTAPALDILDRFWKTQARAETVLLEASSHPALDAVGRAG